MKNSSVFFLIAVATIALSCSSQHADLIVHNAQVYTVDSAFTTAEAFAVRDGEFIAIGTNTEILSKYESTTIIDAQGHPIYPGFYDAHAHFFGFAQSLGQADLTGASSFEEIIDRLQAFRNEFPNAPWLLGRGWDQNLWPIKTFPDRSQLDEAFPDVPVYLTRIDGHAAIANGKALEQAGVTAPETIEGGWIEAQNGRLTGVLIDNAMSLVAKTIPKTTVDEAIQMLQKAEAACLAVGLTTVSDAGLGKSQIDLLDTLYRQERLRIRNHAMIQLSSDNLDRYLQQGPYTSDRFTVRAFKIMADGALGSRGACLLQPYSDGPRSGFLLLPPAAIDSTLARLAASDFQVCTHAIGDSTNRVVLNAYGKHLKGKNDRRWRIEHVQVVAPEDFEKFSTYSIIPSVQPTHATSDMSWAIDRLGPERIKGAYAFKQLLDGAGLLALGSDFPVEQINPLYGFHAAVARVDSSGNPEGGFQPENAIDREAALRGMTIWAAYAFFEENVRGSIEEGKKADFVRLEKDIMHIPTEELRDVPILQTSIAGEIVYERAQK